jgi:hypothetical protein
MIKVILDKPFTRIDIPQRTLPAVTTTGSSVTVTLMLDDPIKRRVIVRTEEFGTVVLWKDDEYDEIGQWTDQDVISRLNEMFNS